MCVHGVEFYFFYNNILNICGCSIIVLSFSKFGDFDFSDCCFGWSITSPYPIIWTANLSSHVFLIAPFIFFFTEANAFLEQLPTSHIHEPKQPTWLYAENNAHLYRLQTQLGLYISMKNNGIKLHVVSLYIKSKET